MSRPLAPGDRIPPELLLRAYASGVFPMSESSDDPEVFWVRPETRGIIPLDRFHIPRSLAKAVRRGAYEIRYDSDFDGVIAGCAQTRPGRANTWINRPIRDAYRALFERGQALSARCQKLLETAELRVQQLAPRPGGGLGLQPFDDGDA